jgi:hypothetical protein
MALNNNTNRIGFGEWLKRTVHKPVKPFPAAPPPPKKISAGSAISLR